MHYWGRTVANYVTLRCLPRGRWTSISRDAGSSLRDSAFGCVKRLHLSEDHRGVVGVFKWTNTECICVCVDLPRSDSEGILTLSHIVTKGGALLVLVHSQCATPLQTQATPCTLRHHNRIQPLTPRWASPAIPLSAPLCHRVEAKIQIGQ